MTDSLALLSQAADSGFDLIALLITLFAVRISMVPPDEDHSYGHGKFENLSALFQAILLFAITSSIGYEAVQRLLGKVTEEVNVTPWSFAVLIVSICLDLWRAHFLRKAGKEHNSQALEASALNFMTDILSAIVALLGLLAVKLFHYPLADSWAALAVAISVVILSIRLGKRAIDGLTDRYAEHGGYEVLKKLILEVPGVEKVRRVRIRQAGPIYFIEATIEVNRTLPFSSIQSIVSDIEKKVTEKYERTDVTIHWIPIRTKIESPFETLKLITAQYGILPHNLELTKNEQGEVHLDYHLEFPSKTGFNDAYKLSRDIENEVHAELPSVSRITTHLEEERSDRSITEVREISARRERLLEEIAFYARAANRGVRGVKDISIAENLASKEIKLILTLCLNGSLSLGEAHDIVTNVEAELQKRFPEIGRIVIHSEPISS